MQFLDIIATEMAKLAKLHSASPREITSLFPLKLYPTYTQKHLITYNKFLATVL